MPEPRFEDSAGLQLRVLSGVHAGASAPLPDDDAPLSLGRGDDNDVVLSDAPFGQAQLAWRDGAWCWADADGSARLQAGQGLRIGGLLLMLAAPDQAWVDPVDWIDLVPADEPAAEPADGPANKPDASLADPTLDRPEADAAQHDAPDEIDLKLPDPAARRPAGQPARWLALVGLLAGLWVMGVWAVSGMGFNGLGGFAVFAGRPAKTQADPVVAVAVDDPALAWRRVVQAIDQAGFAATVRAQPQADGRIRLLGVVDTDEVMEQLLRLLAPAGGRLSLALLTQADFAARVKALAVDSPFVGRWLALEQGRIGFDGALGSDEELRKMREWALAQLPEAAGVVLERPLAAAAAEPVPQAQAAAPPAFPKVSAVVSGDRAYVLLADGRRILPGGMVDELRLAAIQDDALVFETRAGTQHRMTR